MLRSLKKLEGFTIMATDGEIGEVEEFYFDSKDWSVRYVVVDTGRWLPGRKVLLTPESFDKPFWDDKKVPVKLTMEQIKNSPDIDTKMPVSRQQEERLFSHYGWTPYWSGTGVPPAGGPDVGYGAERAEARSRTETNLHSSADVKGYEVQATDGDIGDIYDFLFDDDEWVVRYLVADTGTWLPGKKVLLSPEWIKEIRYADDKVLVDLTKDKIKSSPEYDPDITLSREYETRLYNYYERPSYWERKRAA